MSEELDLLARWNAPYKRKEPALSGSGQIGRYDSQGVDCPFVFRHNGRFYMMHVGFDGIGYQTALATSDDLLNWSFEAVILPRLKDSDRWDWIGAAGSWILLDSNKTHDTPTLRKVEGKYWMVYHSYPDSGYEAGGAVMGLAWTEDEELKDWTRLDKPIFTYEGGLNWENEGLYKCCLLEHEDQYWMFYNAKGDNVWPWKEETGLATSRDLLNWERYAGNPVLPCVEGTFYSQFYSDPCIRHDGTRWLNFGFGFDGVHAQSSLAFSDDLLHWKPIDIPLLPHGEPGELDEIHAHKSSIVEWEGTLYHFYCSCRPYHEGDPTRVEVFEGVEEFRCISVAMNRQID